MDKERREAIVQELLRLATDRQEGEPKPEEYADVPEEVKNDLLEYWERMLVANPWLLPAPIAVIVAHFPNTRGMVAGHFALGYLLAKREALEIVQAIEP